MRSLMYFELPWFSVGCFVLARPLWPASWTSSGVLHERPDLLSLFHGRLELKAQLALGLVDPVKKRLVSIADLL